ncbi:hypothetical protein CFN78_06840 [Amycolatopsis antarctica]|uniref:4Fe-4S Wbl-type domain-containing protein n=2 Tax=Amycolatopsis antarctica TaxID=1854586 RepID=A0A263D9G6_9PSEU|nr:hypothetical protein CFN78_06840 [Amycolatopsis antarctica]
MRRTVDKDGDRVVWNAWIEARPGTPEHRAARLICAACPLRLDCATSALERGEPWGIHGGLDRRDRKGVAAAYDYPPPSVLPDHGTNSRYAKHGCDCQDCKQAHAVYEFDRRARVRRARQQRDIWLSPLAVAGPVTYMRRRQCPGQLLLPLPGLPAPKWTRPLGPPTLELAA